MNHLILISYFNALATCRNAEVKIMDCSRSGFWQVWATREVHDPCERPNSVSVYRGFTFTDSIKKISRQSADMGQALEYQHQKKAYDHDRF